MGIRQIVETDFLNIPEPLSKIEGRTKEDLIRLLKLNGIGKSRKRRWHDYEKAKKICFEGLFIDSSIYDRQIGWICDYLKL